MTDQQTNTGAPGGAPGAPGGTRSFVERRAPVMAETMERQLAERERQSAQREQPAGDAEHEHAGEQQRSQEQRQQQAPAKIRVGDADFTAEELQSAVAAKAEAEIRKSGLPSAPEGYEARNTPDFKLPEGVNYAFNEQDPALAAAKKFALANNLTQEQFSGMLDVFVSTQVGELMNRAQMRTRNLDALGVAGPQRIGAVATWLKSMAGKDGAAVADFIIQFPSAPFVRSLETVIKRFSNQGGADYSGQHRETPDADAGKIPGYENMSFAQKRAWQMAQQFGRSPPGGRRGE